MAYPEFLKTGWEDNVRALCGGVSTTDVSNAMLALDSYGPASEDFLKELIADWSTLKATYPTEFNRAGYAHVAAKVCSYLKVKLLSSEKIGSDYSYTLQKIDWDRLTVENLAIFYRNVGLIDADILETLNVIEISDRDPSLYGELIVEEEI